MAPIELAAALSHLSSQASRLSQEDSRASSAVSPKSSASHSQLPPFRPATAAPCSRRGPSPCVSGGKILDAASRPASAPPAWIRSSSVFLTGRGRGSASDLASPQVRSSAGRASTNGLRDNSSSSDALELGGFTGPCNAVGVAAALISVSELEPAQESRGHQRAWTACYSPGVCAGSTRCLCRTLCSVPKPSQSRCGSNSMQRSRYRGGVVRTCLMYNFTVPKGTPCA